MRIAETKKAVLGLFSAGEDIQLADYMIHELLAKDHSSAKISASLNSLLREKKLSKTGQGSVETIILTATFQLQKQRLSESTSVTNPTMF